MCYRYLDLVGLNNAAQVRVHIRMHCLFMHVRAYLFIYMFRAGAYILAKILSMTLIDIARISSRSIFLKCRLVLCAWSPH